MQKTEKSEQYFEATVEPRITLIKKHFPEVTFEATKVCAPVPSNGRDKGGKSGRRRHSSFPEVISYIIMYQLSTFLAYLSGVAAKAASKY